MFPSSFIPHESFETKTIKDYTITQLHVKSVRSNDNDHINNDTEHDDNE